MNTIIRGEYYGVRTIKPYKNPGINMVRIFDEIYEQNYIMLLEYEDTDRIYFECSFRDISNRKYDGYIQGKNVRREQLLLNHQQLSLRYVIPEYWYCKYCLQKPIDEYGDHEIHIDSQQKYDIENFAYTHYIFRDVPIEIFFTPKGWKQLLKGRVM